MINKHIMTAQDMRRRRNAWLTDTLRVLFCDAPTHSVCVCVDLWCVTQMRSVCVGLLSRTWTLRARYTVYSRALSVPRPPKPEDVQRAERSLPATIAVLRSYNGRGFRGCPLTSSLSSVVTKTQWPRTISPSRHVRLGCTRQHCKPRSTGGSSPRRASSGTLLLRRTLFQRHR